MTTSELPVALLGPAAGATSAARGDRSGRLASSRLRRSAPLVLLLASACMTWSREARVGAAHNQTGVSHFNAGRYAQAESEFTEALTLVPDSALYQHNLALVRIEQGRLAEAQALLSWALARASEDKLRATIEAGLGYSCLLERRLEEALGHYRNALALNPVNAVAHRKLVEVAFEYGALDQIMGELENAENGADPNNPDGVDRVFLPEQAILHALGLQGKYGDVVARATKDLDALREVKTDFAPQFVVIPTPFFTYWRNTAGRHLNTVPVKESLLRHRAHAYLAQGMLDEAMADFSQIAGDGKLGPQRYYGLGLIALERGDGKEASYDLRRFTEALPNDAAGLLYYSAALHLSGETALEEAVHRRIQANSPPRYPVLKSSLEVVKAQAFVDQVWKRHDRALAGYQWVLFANPAYGQAYRKMGEVLLERGENARAAEVLRRALELCPRDVAIPALLEKARVQPAPAPSERL